MLLCLPSPSCSVSVVGERTAEESAVVKPGVVEEPCVRVEAGQVVVRGQSHLASFVRGQGNLSQ